MQPHADGIERFCIFGSDAVCVACHRRTRFPKSSRVCCGEPGCTQAATPRVLVPVSRGGPGTELKKILASVGIVATPNCSCNVRARLMDENEQREPGWCEANTDTIVSWLREEAEKRGLPFLDAAGRLLVKRAIRNARKAAS